jgi:hypothetical protein
MSRNGNRTEVKEKFPTRSWDILKINRRRFHVRRPCWNHLEDRSRNPESEGRLGAQTSQAEFQGCAIAIARIREASIALAFLTAKESGKLNATHSLAGDRAFTYVLYLAGNQLFICLLPAISASYGSWSLSLSFLLSLSLSPE